jgi:hypothetical protein
MTAVPRYGGRREIHGELLESKKAEWQKREEERLDGLLQRSKVKKMWEAIRSMIKRGSSMRDRTRKVDGSLQQPVSQRHGSGTNKRD